MCFVGECRQTSRTDGTLMCVSVSLQTVHLSLMRWWTWTYDLKDSALDVDSALSVGRVLSIFLLFTPGCILWGGGCFTVKYRTPCCHYLNHYLINTWLTFMNDSWSYHLHIFSVALCSYKTLLHKRGGVRASQCFLCPQNLTTKERVESRGNCVFNSSTQAY